MTREGTKNQILITFSSNKRHDELTVHTILRELRKLLTERNLDRQQKKKSSKRRVKNSEISKSLKVSQ